MSYRTEELLENPSTYFVQDRGNLEEMHRLATQDQMLTTGMGGVLPELADPSKILRVLDVGCGTGGWLLETARTYPTIEELFGADISSKILDYARVQAATQHLDERVQFQTMDALRVLEFQACSFDLVNQRLGASWLRTWEWRKILVEYHRVTRPGGIIRITEMNAIIESNSPALTKLGRIGLEAAYNSGRLFEAESSGVTGKLVGLLTQHAFQNVQSHLHRLTYQAGTKMGQDFGEDMARFYRVALPFLQRWTRVPSNYEEIYQKALTEMQQPDFVATWTFLTAWGISDGRPLLMRGLR